MQSRLIGSTSYFTRAQLEASNPSRREGIDVVAEARWRSTTSKLVKTAIKALKLPDWVYETSMNYINRFFLTRSISKNDRHLVVGGALLLASKVQESPRSVQDVAYVLLQLKNANKQKAQQGPDQTTLEQFIEGVVLAEQAMLFSMNFDLNVETHVSLARRLLEPLDLWAKANPAPEETEANQLKLSLYSAVMFFLNDSALTNLSLQTPNSKVAPVTLVMAAKRMAALRYAGKEIPALLQRVLSLANDVEWFASKGLTLESAADIEAQINELYATSPGQPSATAQQHRQPQATPAQVPVSGGQGANANHSQQQQPQQATATAEPHREGNGQLAGSVACPRPLEGFNEACPHGQVVAEQAVAGRVPECSGPAAPHCRSASPGAAEALSGPVLTPQCDGMGQPSSSAAAPSVLGTAAEGTPELPHPPSPSHPADQQQLQQCCRQQRICKRLSDGDDCCKTGDEQATSELHAVLPQADADGQAGPGALETSAAPCDNGGGSDNGNDDSANENCSPNGLTTGNASGSGCCIADGLPEICSRPDYVCQQLQSRPSEPQLGHGGAGCRGSQPPRCAKRTRGSDDLEVASLMEGCISTGGIKAQRLEDVQPMAMQP